MRRKIAAGNWKMNMTPAEAEALITGLKPEVEGAGSEVICCVPAIDIERALKAAEGSNIQIGAQNMFYEAKGAYTGEISGEMLLSVGVSHVIIGHSERRGIFGETDEDINKKLKKAISLGLTPIVCCGESLEQREKGITEEWVRMQVKEALIGVSAEDVKRIIIAYEPIWAIGTGKTATTSEAEEVCGLIRECIAALYDQETADEIRILYGGSVNEKNAAELFAMPDIDGGLVGGASLKLSFAEIVKAADKIS